MDNNIEHAEKAMHYCSQIKKAINGLCQILDLGDDPFDEMSRLETYKSMLGAQKSGRSNTPITSKAKTSLP